MFLHLLNVRGNGEKNIVRKYISENKSVCENDSDSFAKFYSFANKTRDNTIAFYIFFKATMLKQTCGEQHLFLFILFSPY